MSRGILNNTINKNSFKSQSGQIAVIVFLIMAVLLVVGLSLATRTSQEIELAGQQEDTTRVFNAAETGIEQALSNQGNFIPGANSGQQTVTLPADIDGNTEATVTVNEQNDYDGSVPAGLSATVFTDPTQTGTLTIHWGTHAIGDCNNLAALIITTYTKSGTTYQAEHQGVRPGDCHSGTKFDNSVSGGSTYNGVAYTYSKAISVGSNTVMVRIKPLFASARLYISGTGSIMLPQLHTIRSQAQDTSSGNTEVRTIEVTRTRPAPPLILDYALYSGGTLVKQ